MRQLSCTIGGDNICFDFRVWSFSCAFIKLENQVKLVFGISRCVVVVVDFGFDYPSPTLYMLHSATNHDNDVCESNCYFIVQLSHVIRFNSFFVLLHVPKILFTQTRPLTTVTISIPQQLQVS